MSAAAARAVTLARVRTLPPPPGVAGVLALVKLLSDTMREAKAAARAASRRYPFMDW